MLDKISEFLANSGGAVLMALGLVFALALGLVFCTVGGLIGGAVFKKDGAPTPPAATM